MTEAYQDSLGESGVYNPPRKALPIVIGAMVVLALLGFYMGLNSGDRTTRLPGDTRGAVDASVGDLSRARVAVAIAPEDIAPPPPPEEPKVEAPVQQEAAPAPVAAAPPPPVVEAPPPAAPTAAPPAPPPSLEGLF